MAPPRRPLNPYVQQRINQCIARGIPYWHPLQKCYKLGTTPLRGANKELRRQLYPDYVQPRHVGGGGRGGGLLRGKIVDRQISNWAASKGTKLPRRLHPYTRKLIDAFRAWNWRPLYSQVVVCQGGLGTALDVIVRDLTTNALVALEIKAGFHGYWTTAQGNLQPPLAHIASCPQHHAFLQLALGCHLAQSRIRLNLAYVVRVEEDGVFRSQVPEWSFQAVARLNL